METCPLCNRELGSVWDEHHLIPKTFKGTETVPMHKMCHNAVHATFTERELLQYYHTVERLLEHEKIQRFVAWIRKKPVDFYEKIKDTNERKGKRRR